MNDSANTENGETCYQVLVDYHDNRRDYQSRMQTAQNAREQYVTLCGANMHGVKGVYLCRYGVVVALATF